MRCYFNNPFPSPPLASMSRSKYNEFMNITVLGMTQSGIFLHQWELLFRNIFVRRRFIRFFGRWNLWYFRSWLGTLTTARYISYSCRSSKFSFGLKLLNSILWEVTRSSAGWLAALTAGWPTRWPAGWSAWWFITCIYIWMKISIR